jgi:imidazolonepropionase
VAFDLLLTNASAAVMDGAQPFGLVRNGAVGATKGRVAWIGRVADVPAGGAGKTWSIGGKVLTPGLVDPQRRRRAESAARSRRNPGYRCG